MAINWIAKPIDNFSLAEIRCHGWEQKDDYKVWHDCGLVILVPELLECIFRVRVRYGRPIIIKSWTRCIPHNIAVGGKRDSYHLNGHAVDIAPQDMNGLDILYEIAHDEFPLILRYSWGFHCDIRGQRPC